jgi:hypothetical protein
MTRINSDLERVMHAARPFPPSAFEDAWNDEVGQRTLAAILREDTAADDASGAGLISSPRRPARRSRRMSVPYATSLAAVVIAITGLAIAVSNAGTGTASRPAAPAAAGHTASAPAVMTPEPASTTPLPTSPATAAIHGATKACARDVRAAVEAMITAYRQAGGGRSQAQQRLALLHDPSSLDYHRDLAAFDDWLARGARDDKSTLDSVVGHACVQ